MPPLLATLILVLAAPLALCVGVLWVLLRPARRAYSRTRMVPPSTLLMPRPDDRAGS